MSGHFDGWDWPRARSCQSVRLIQSSLTIIWFNTRSLDSLDPSGVTEKTWRFSKLFGKLSLWFISSCEIMEHMWSSHKMNWTKMYKNNLGFYQDMTIIFHLGPRTLQLLLWKKPFHFRYQQLCTLARESGISDDDDRESMSLSAIMSTCNVQTNCVKLGVNNANG